MFDILLYLGSLLLGFLLTISIEVLIAFLLGFRHKNEIKTIALASVITYPALQMLIAFRYTSGIDYSGVSLYVILLEIVVVVIEFLVLYYVFQSKYKWQGLFLISLVMNAFSYGIGLLFF